MRREYFLIIIVSILCALIPTHTGGAVVGDTCEPVVAGQFYPGTETELKEMINKLKDAVPENVLFQGRPVVLFSPHAGYVYSGNTAAFGFYQIRNFKIKTFIIIGPTHRVPLKKASVGNFKYFKTPLGKVEVDVELANRIIDKDKTKFDFNSTAFLYEHSVEVQVPFIQSFFPGSKIIPIVMPQDIEVVKALSTALTEVIGKREDILIIASTDMSHFHNSKKAIEMDKKALKLIKDLDYVGLIKSTKAGECELCGLAPVLTAILTAKSLGAGNVKIFQYTHSGIVSGDNKRVVGYFSGVISKTIDTKEESKDMILNDKQKKEVLKIARETIETYLKTGKEPDFNITDSKLKEKYGCFVTLHKNKNLRGCIGHFEADTALHEIVMKMAIQASLHDPRFPAVKLSEMKDIEIEISVLSPLKETDSPLSIKKDVHGIYIQEKGGYRGGTYLPQVWSEHFSDKDAEYFWGHLCKFKAGFPSDAWKKPEKYKIMIYSAEVFSEGELLDK